MTIAPGDAEELRDVNERLLISGLRAQESAEAAHRDKAQLGAVIEALNEGVVLLGASGHALMMSSVAFTIAGLSTRQAASVDPLALSFRHLDDTPLPAHQHPLGRALRGEAFVDAELLLVRASGERRRLMVSGRSVASFGDGALAVVVLRDVTERHQLEERLAQSEKLAALGTLSAGMAHEINTPLAYALGNVDFVLEALPALEARLLALGGSEIEAIGTRLRDLADALVEAKDGGQRVRLIVADLKQMGLAEARGSAVVELRGIAEAALRMTANYVRHLAVVRLDYGATPPVRAKASQLVQVFSNLLMNAAYASGGDAARSEDAADFGEIVVATYTDGLGRAVAEVRDSGCGVADELKGRIFDPFVTTKPIGKGTGLGLSICFSIVQSLGGELSFTSELGKGATFRVVLPAAGPEPATSVPAIAAAVPIRAPEARGRVLVVDDEPAIGRMIKRLLESEHDVVTSVDGREALGRLLRGEAFDVILCDLMMPGLGGPEVYAALLGHDPEMAKRVVFVTGGAFTPRTEAFLESVTNVKLLKPIEPALLRSVVAEHVKRARSCVAST